MAHNSSESTHDLESEIVPLLQRHVDTLSDLNSLNRRNLLNIAGRTNASDIRSNHSDSDEPPPLVPAPPNTMLGQVQSFLEINGARVPLNELFLEGIGRRFQVILPFLLMFIFRFIYDHMINLILLSILLHTFQRFQRMLDEQISLKSRYSRKHLYLLVLSCTFFIILFHLIVKITTKIDLWKFLIGIGNNKNTKMKIEFLWLFWLASVIDYLLLLVILIMKSIICLFHQSTYKFPCNQTNETIERDIETNNSNHSNTTNNNNRNQSQTQNQLQSQFHWILQIFYHSIYPLNSSTNIHENNSDDTNINEESSKYLLLLRIFACIDGLSLIYRAIIPIFIWVIYYPNDVLFAVYISMKMLQISHRIKETLDIFKLTILNQLVSYFYFKLIENTSNYSIKSQILSFYAIYIIQ